MCCCCRRASEPYLAIALSLPALPLLMPVLSLSHAVIAFENNFYYFPVLFLLLLLLIAICTHSLFFIFSSLLVINFV